MNSQEVSQKFPAPVALRDSDAAEELQASSCHGAPEETHRFTSEIGQKLCYLLGIDCCLVTVSLLRQKGKITWDLRNSATSCCSGNRLEGT